MAVSFIPRPLAHLSPSISSHCTSFLPPISPSNPRLHQKQIRNSLICLLFLLLCRDVEILVEPVLVTHVRLGTSRIDFEKSLTRTAHYILSFQI